jgi:hypothetical protein
VANHKQDHSQFGSQKPVQSGDPQHCAQCEAMLMDAVDGTLSPADQSAFDLHLLSCVTCSAMVADAQRGAAWLEMLKSPRPEPSAALLERILAQTSGQVSGVATTSSEAIATGKTSPTPFLVPTNAHAGHPALSAHSRTAPASSKVLPFRSRIAASFNLRAIGHNLLQPRLAMTAAMAFFSFALTLNLTGIKLTALRASDLRPSSLKRSISEANAHVVRYYDNLRVVYELESRVHDLQRSSESDNSTPASTPANSNVKPAGNDQPKNQPGQQEQQNPDKPNQDKQDKPRPRPGTSRRENPPADPGGNLRYVVAGSSSRNTVPSPVPHFMETLAVLLPRVIPCNTYRQAQEGRLV